ncbi:helix-turn-helix domain-containing protein [Shewanella sp. Isolate13]|uniref:helix-turn-helix domain-containing protein n=1 Tax=Shewanella sp. Isolate13 TaxID=2908531 RepID=UPI001EFEC8EE|nr:helix-turn-helix domain-containing protein [Shewanella sp. Isolate13]MCG9730970.1 helix-turn-helix domain-containing protein [Shewanella sp. Isolate13]
MEKVSDSMGRPSLRAKRSNIDVNEKDALMLAVSRELLTGRKTPGQALKFLRVEMLSVNQEQYARMVGVTRKILSEIEGDKSKANVYVLNKVLRGVGLCVSILPRDNYIKDKLFNEDNNLG